MRIVSSVPVCAIALALFSCGKGGGSGPDIAADAGAGVGGRAAGTGGQAAASTGGASGTGGATGTGSGGATGTGGAVGTGGATGTGGAAPVDARPDDPDGGPARDAAAADAPPAADAGGGSGGTGGGAAPWRPSCSAGPFQAPMVQSTRAVCANFAFNHTFNEGPTWVASQNAFFFTNFLVRRAMGGDIIKYTPGGTCEIFIRDVGCNGLAASPDGNLLAACHQSRSVIRFDLTTKQPTTLASSYMGTMLDTPNDLIAHSNGTIYFTNPNYELDGRPPGVGLAVFRIDPSGVLSLIARTACNGIGLAPDQRKLYVLQAGIWDLDALGIPGTRTDSSITRGDGMAVDCAGNVYASGSIFSPQGQTLGSYPNATNLAFGGADGRTLLLAGPGVQVRELQMNVPGFP